MDGTSSLLATRVPIRPNQLDAGTVIPAALATAINSDLPGHLLAYVTRNVYDSRTQRTIVIPQGTKLIGDYNNTIAGGQQRLLIAWTRLIFPNGASVTLPGLNSTDATGASGVPGYVDTHTRRVFGNALLLSVLSAGIQLSQPRQGNVYAPPTAGQVAAGAVGQQLGDVATEMLRKNLEIPPTITLAAGTPFNVWLASDLVLPTR
jgi:type IV secretion system protein VirB10